LSKLETIPIGTEFNRQEYFDQLLEDNYQAYARRAEVSPDNKEKNPDGFIRRRCTCDNCPQPFPWLSRTEIEERGGENYPIYEIGEKFYESTLIEGEWINWGSIRSWQYWKKPQVKESFFYTTRCTSCDSKNRRVSRSQNRIDDVINAVGYPKFVALTKPVIVLRTVPTNTEIQKSMKEHAAIFRRRLSNRRVMLKKAIGPSTFGYYWLECVVRAYQDDSLQEEVDHDDPEAKAWTLHPHIHAVWSASKKSWNLDIFRDWWSPSGKDGEGWRNNVVEYSSGQVADYVNKKSINQTMVEYVNKQATYWDSGFRTCNKFGSWSPSAKSKRRILRHHRDELFKGEKLSKKEKDEYKNQLSLAFNLKGWLYKKVNHGL
jgi:hypothetical protein